MPAGRAPLHLRVGHVEDLEAAIEPKACLPVRPHPAADGVTGLQHGHGGPGRGQVGCAAQAGQPSADNDGARSIAVAHRNSASPRFTRLDLGKRCPRATGWPVSARLGIPSGSRYQPHDLPRAGLRAALFWRGWMKTGHGGLPMGCVTVASTGTWQGRGVAFGVIVSLHDGREAEWDTDGTAGLEAQVMQDGVLVGFVPVIEGSEDFDEQQVIDAIVRTHYDQPVATQRAAHRRPPRRCPGRVACSAGSSTASDTARPLERVP